MKLTHDLKADQKHLRKNYLHSINEKLCEARLNNNGRIPCGLVQSIVNESKQTMPLTRSIINKSFEKFVINKQTSVQTCTNLANTTQNNLQDKDRVEVANILTDLSNQTNTSPSNQRKGGRPKDSTCNKKKFLTMANAAFINEVAVKHKAEKESTKGRVPKGRFDELANEIRILRKIDNSMTVSKATIDRRIQRGNLVLSSTLGGKPSPLAPCEDCFADMIAKLSRCRHSMTSGEGLQLMNSLTKNAEIESAMKQ